MTTDTELRDLLTTKAQGAIRTSAPWDDVVRRGRHHRRMARVRTGLAAVGVAALVVGGIVAADLGRDERTGVIADQPDGPETTIDRSQPDLSRLPDLSVARASGFHVTLLLGASVPDEGFDPCTEQAPVVTETASDVTIDVAKAFEMPGVTHWLTCQSSPFISWATIELDEPFGSRRLIDASDGAEIEVVDQSHLLFPTALPAPFDIARWDEFGTSAEADIDYWSFSFTVGDLVLNVIWGPLAGDPPPGCAGAPVEVRGVDGALCVTESDIRLTWTDASSFRSIEIVDVGGNPLPDGIDLLAIAEGLEPLG